MDFLHHRKHILMGAIFSIALIYFAFSFMNLNEDNLYTGQTLQAHIASTDLHSSGFFEFTELFLNDLIAFDNSEKINTVIQLGITAHHLPTASSFIESFYSTLKNSKGPRDTFIIIGPDHFERCNSNIAVTNKSYSTPFGVLSVNTEIVNALIERVAELDADCFEDEHSIGVQTIFIKQKFPNAEIVPILVSASADEAEITLISEVLSSYLNKITVVASVDFSHYKPYDQAQILDNQTEREIINLDTSFLTLEHADSPPSVNLLVLLARQFNAKPIILGRANSYEFTGRYDNTTGYINIVFTGDLNKNSEQARLVFVGDIMLDRLVDEVFKIRGQEVFSAVRELAQDSDLFIFNHEGTFPDKDIPQDLKSLYFSFRDEPLQALREAGAGIAGLANNHSYNFGKDIFTQTQNNLLDLGFEIFGLPNNQVSGYEILKKEIKGKKIILYGYNQFGGNKNKTASLLQENSAQGQLDIVFAHWGEEYQKTSNDFQRETARLFFESGADVIIGHHPHIVQPFEKIGDKIVFYSLGNFIFDQYFSEPTQYGLALKLTIERDKVYFSPTPVSLKQSIPKIESPDLLDNENLYPGFGDINSLIINNF